MDIDCDADIYTYQTGLNVLHTYLKIDTLHFADFEHFYTEQSLMNITNDFLFCITENDFNNVINKYKLYNWYITNNIDSYLDEILLFINVLKSKIIPNCILTN
jgi:hypothetical protein